MDNCTNERRASTHNSQKLLYIAIDSLNLEYSYTVSIIYLCVCIYVSERDMYFGPCFDVANVFLPLSSMS